MRCPVSWIEFHLRHPEKLASLSNERLKFYWAQREWHPQVQFAWDAEIKANGEGLTTYADGSKETYAIDKRSIRRV